MKRYIKVWISFTFMLVGLLILFITMFAANMNIKPASLTINNDVSSNNMYNGVGSNLPIDSNNGGIISKTIVKITFWYKLFIFMGSLLFIIGFVYFFLSLFGEKAIFGIQKKRNLYFLLCLIFTILLTYGNVYLTNNYILNRKELNLSKDLNNSPTIKSTSAKQTVDGTTLTLDDNYEASNSDENVILIKNKGNATIKNNSIEKYGDTNKSENANIYGINSAILTQKGSTTLINNSKIYTEAKGANGIYATGENAKTTITNSTLTTSLSSSRGLTASFGGSIEGTNLYINTKGKNSSCLATDRGEGIVNISASNLETEGTSSPIINSTGSISITNTNGNALSSQLAIIEGYNSATLTNSNLSGSGLGSHNNIDDSGIMLYQTTSGNSNTGMTSFTAKDSNLTINYTSKVYKSAPMFFITNTSAIIKLTNTTLSYGSNILISIKGTNKWGTINANGGSLDFIANSEKLEGNIEVDKLSAMNLTLLSSKYKGTINNSNTAKNINITLDKDSVIELTADSFINKLTDEDISYDNIKSNGHSIYYDGIDKIKLKDGGYLIPNK